MSLLSTGTKAAGILDAEAEQGGLSPASAGAARESMLLVNLS